VTLCFSPLWPVAFAELAVVQAKEHSKLHCAKCLERWTLSGKSENELVPKFRVIFAAKLYFLQFKQRETSPRNKPGSRTYKNPGSCRLKSFPDNPPVAQAFRPESLVLAANANWHSHFLQRHQARSEAKLLVTSHRPGHDMAAGQYSDGILAHSEL
jgi:hypothetical protein